MFLTANDPFETRFERLKEIINESKKISFFGGAGVSTGSGIPDFRSPNGLYNNPPKEYADFSPEFLLSHDCFIKQPTIFFDFIRRYMDLRSYEPNSVHKYLYELEKQQKLVGIITQNVDMLHEKAGSTKIHKIHGTLGKTFCAKCGKSFGPDFIYENTDPIPRCTDCGGIIRPDVTLYGEKLPTKAVNSALETLTNSDCVLIAGTSLKVQPAAGLISEFTGKYMVIFNIDETPYDTWSDVVFREDMNMVFDKLMKSV